MALVEVALPPLLLPAPVEQLKLEGWMEGGRKGGREKGREGGREGEREGGREGGREGEGERLTSENSLSKSAVSVGEPELE